jgi:hypothetical protein
VNNVLLGRYWPLVGSQEALFTSNTAQGVYYAGWQKGMVVVNNVLLGRYWLRVGPRRCSLPVYCAGWQKGMVVVNNVLLGRYWSRVGPPGDALYLYTTQGGRREWWW